MSLRWIRWVSRLRPGKGDLQEALQGRKFNEALWVV